MISVTPRQLEDIAIFCACGRVETSFLLGERDWLARERPFGTPDPGESDADDEVDGDPSDAVDDAVDDELTCEACGEPVVLEPGDARNLRSRLSRAERDWLDEYIEWKRTIRRALLRGRSVATVFGSFFCHGGQELIGRNPMTGGNVAVAGRRTAVFLPTQELIDAAAPGSISRATIERMLASDKSIWEHDGADSLPLPIAVEHVPAPSLRLAQRASWDDVVSELGRHPDAVLRGLGRFAIREVGHELATGRLLHFVFDDAFGDALAGDA